MNTTFPDSLKFSVTGHTADLDLSVAATIEVDIVKLVGLAKSASSGFTVPILVET